MAFFSDERATELRDLFFESAQELLQALNDEGLELERNPRDPEVLRDIRRTVHTLKGDSAACGFRELSELAHELEETFTADVSQNDNGNLVELVLHAADTFDSMLIAYRGHGSLPKVDHIRSMIQRLLKAEAPQVSTAPQADSGWTEYEQLLIEQGASKGATLYSVAVEVDPQAPMRMATLQLLKNVMQGLGSILAVRPEGDMLPDQVSTIRAVIASFQPIEVITKKLSVPAITRQATVQDYRQSTNPVAITPVGDTKPQAADAVDHKALPMPTHAPEHPEDEAAATPSTASIAPENLLRVDAERIDTVLNLVGELIIGKSMLNQTLSDFAKQNPKDPMRGKFADAMAFQAQILNELQRAVMKIRMVPVEQLFRRFPRIVRDVARASGKECDLILAGQTTDLDKSILDALAEPLMHLVRNAVDHGIEPAIERLAAGKPAKGTLMLNAFYQGNQVVIELTDDGHGIDRKAVVAKAIAKGIVTAQEAEKLTESEALSLIFRAGLSTATAVTEISGRGMGMDIVESVLRRLKGSVSVRTELAQGTTVQLRVPLTLAIMQALLFRVAGRLYAVPLGSVVEISRTSPQNIHNVDHHEVLQLRDEIVTLVRLDQLSGKKTPSPSVQAKIFVIVVSFGDRRFGLIVDQLEGEEELVVKALDDGLVATELVSGASILGDGTVVLILNVAAVVDRLGRAVRADGLRRMGTSA